jgi:hypothetical protein
VNIGSRVRRRRDRQPQEATAEIGR